MRMYFKNTLYIALVLSIFWLFLPTRVASADMGPSPPSMYFSFRYLIPKRVVVDAKLFLCEDKECKNFQEFESGDYFSYAFSSFYCSGDNDYTEWCYAGAIDIDFVEYHKLSLAFDDGVVRESNVFRKKGYSSYYVVKIGENDLEVEEDKEENSKIYNMFSPFQNLCFAPCAIITLLIETKVAKRYSKKLRKPIKFVLLANLISLPTVWFVIPDWLDLPFLWTFIIVELFALIFEALLIYALNRKSGLALKDGVATSVLINSASVGTGVIIIGLFILVNFLFSLF